MQVHIRFRVECGYFTNTVWYRQSVLIKSGKRYNLKIIFLIYCKNLLRWFKWEVTTSLRKYEKWSLNCLESPFLYIALDSVFFTGVSAWQFGIVFNIVKGEKTLHWGIKDLLFLYLVLFRYKIWLGIIIEIPEHNTRKSEDKKHEFSSRTDWYLMIIVRIFHGFFTKHMMWSLIIKLWDYLEK